MIPINQIRRIKREIKRKSLNLNLKKKMGNMIDWCIAGYQDGRIVADSNDIEEQDKKKELKYLCVGYYLDELILNNIIITSEEDIDSLVEILYNSTPCFKK